MHRTLLLICGLALTTQVGAGPLPERFSASYSVHSHGANLGTTRWSLTPQGDHRYVFQTESKADGFWALFLSGKRVERTVWEYEGSTLRPLSYSYERTGGKPRRVSIRFDWTKGVAYNTSRGETWTLEVKPGTLDKLLYFLALMRDLADGSNNLEYTFTDGGKVKTYHLEVLGHETLDTPLGSLDTVKVRRQHESNERETTLWCAPALHYLPVRVEHLEKGQVVSMQISSVDGLR